MMELNREDRNKLRLLLDKHFDDGELRDLCFELEIEYENLPGAAKKDKIRALVSYCERHLCLDKLLVACRALRSGILWPGDMAAKPRAATKPPQSESGVTITGENVTIQGNITGTSVNYYSEVGPTDRQADNSPTFGRPHNHWEEIFGIPSHLYNQMRAVLLDCGSFATDQELKAIFVDERLYLWRNQLPQADNPTTRVKRVIDFLYNQSNNVGENALILLLHVLSEHIDSGDACHKRLKDLANELV